MNFKIEPEFENYLKLNEEREEESYKKLEARIVSDKVCRNPLVVWAGEDVLVGGHRRYKICLKHNIPYTVVKKEFNSEDDVKLWMIEDQDGQRNWSEEEETIMMGRAVELRKKQGKRTDLTKGQNDPKLNTYETVGKQFGKSAATAKRAAKTVRDIEKLKSIVPEVETDFLARKTSRVSIKDATGIMNFDPEKAKKVLAGEKIMDQMSVLESAMTTNSGLAVIKAFFTEVKMLAKKAFIKKWTSTLTEDGIKAVQKDFKIFFSEMEEYQDQFIKNITEEK